MPTAFQLSAPELIQVYEPAAVLLGPGHFRTHAQDPGHGRRARAGRGAAQVLPRGSKRVFRIPKLPSVDVRFRP